MAILTATDALYMILYTRCPSYLNEAEEAIKEAIKNGKTEALITLSRIYDLDKETGDDGENLALICCQNSSDKREDWFPSLAKALEHPKEEWFLHEGIDPEVIKKALESYAFKFMKDKALLASYLVEELGYKVAIDLEEFIDTNNLTISWVWESENF
jgi:hypothetical protein